MLVYILHTDLGEDLVHEGTGEALAGLDALQLALLLDLDGLSSLGQLLGVLGLDDQDAVAIAHQDVARADDLAAHADGEVDLTGAVLVGTVGDDALGIDGEVGELGQLIPVTDTAVDDEAGNAAAAGIGGHDLAAQGAAHAAAGSDDQHVAGLSQIQSLVEHQVVTGGALHGEGGAQQGRGVHGAKLGLDGGEAVHAVVDVGHGDAAEGLHQAAVGTDNILLDSASNGHDKILLSVSTI